MGQETVLYVSCGETQEIICFAMDPVTGDLERRSVTRLPGAPAPGQGVPAHATERLRSNGAPLAIDPAGRVLFAAMRTLPCRVVSFRISPKSGDLEWLCEAPVPEGTVYLATDRAGRWLLGAAYHSNAVWAARIAEGSGVEQAPVQVVEGIVTPHSAVLHPSNRFAYAGATGEAGVQIFDFAGEDPPLRARRAAPPSLPDATPRHLAMHHEAKFLFCMNESSSIVDVFAIGDDGRTLAKVHSADQRPAGQQDSHGLGADLQISKDGRFLYCCERKRGTINVFAVDQTSGALSPVQSVDVGLIPRSLALDPSGRFFASAIQGDGLIHIHAVSPDDGRLRHCATYETGGTPIWVQFVTLA
ncbi:MAG: lactonase family protein [Novosphingobium sp.]